MIHRDRRVGALSTAFLDRALVRQSVCGRETVLKKLSSRRVRGTRPNSLTCASVPLCPADACVTPPRAWPRRTEKRRTYFVLDTQSRLCCSR
jgi:hypothetical protein